MIEKIYSLFINGKYEELKIMLTKLVLDQRQAEFEKYLKKGILQKEDHVISPCKYGYINDKHLFSNDDTVYIMDRHFDVKKMKSGYIRKPFVKPIEVSTQTLEKWLKYVDKLSETLEPITVHVDEIADRTFTIFSSIGMVSFNSEYIKQMYKILGNDLSIKLNPQYPSLMAEGNSGKAYILGFKRASDIEVRKFHT